MLQYVTTNEGKVREAKAYLDSVEQFEFDYTEIQADELGPIAAAGAREAARVTNKKVLVDDAGLFIDGFDGFPGPYSAFVEESVGIDTVQRMAERELSPPRTASFRCALAFCEGVNTDSTETKSAHVFTGSVKGKIVSQRGDQGFGYDPIFEVDGHTLAEMTPEEKNTLSHRGRALEAFSTWFASEY
jgi:XTP/dITP diphosphohydrolase